MDGLPYYLRFLGKFTFDILPAALASVIGGFLFTQYHTARTAEPLTVIETAAPAQMEEAMRMVRDEHSLIVDFLKGQQAETAKRNASFDDARARAATETREAVLRETIAREAAEKLAALKRREAEQARLKPAVEPAKPAIELAAVEPVRAPMPIGPMPIGPAAIAPATSQQAAPAQAANDLRPPADIPNEPHRTGPIAATIGFARDVTGKAVSTVLEIPSWIGGRILGSAPSLPSPSARVTSTQW